MKPPVTHVLNVPVSSDLLNSWAEWLAPPRPPFFLTSREAGRLGLETRPRGELALSPEERDTFALWNVSPEADRVARLGEAEWKSLSASSCHALLRAQVRHGRGAVPRVRDFSDLLPGLTETRFVWWPSLVTPAVLARVVAQDGLDGQRAAVPGAVWEAAHALLPGARALAGTFPHASGPNCFGTVMGAAGVEGAEREWMQREPFEVFLASRTRPGGQDGAPGTLLVWRDVAGAAQHAAVILGGGWALHKPSQSWMTPRVVLPVERLKRFSRTRGWRLHRFRLHPSLLNR